MAIAAAATRTADVLGLQKVSLKKVMIFFF
jgi:hypothetical protein